MATIARAPTDTPTVDAWAALVRMSRSTLEHRCRAAGARPKDALALGRLLRAISIGDPGHWRPEDVLDVLDHRTLVALLTRGGVVTHGHAGLDERGHPMCLRVCCGALALMVVAGQQPPRPGTVSANLLEPARDAIASAEVRRELKSLRLDIERTAVQLETGWTRTGGLTLDYLIPDGFLRTSRPTAPLPGMSVVAGPGSDGFRGDRLIRRVSPGPGNPTLRALSDTETREEVAELRMEASVGLAALLLAPETPVHLDYRHVGTAESRDGRADVIDATGAGPLSVRLFLDQATHQVLMMTVARPSRGLGRLEQRWYLSDAKSSSGLVLPRSIVIEGPRFREQWRVKAVEVNGRLPADLAERHLPGWF